MRIVIIGGGGVGQALAAILVEEDHDVTVIEASATRAALLGAELDCRVLTGSGATPADLRHAGVQHADILIAASSHDEANVLSCILASKLGCNLTVARVSEPGFVDLSTEGAGQDLSLGELGVSQVINPDREAALDVMRLLEAPGTTEVVPLAGGAMSVAGMLVDEHSSLCGSALVSLRSFPEWRACRVVTIRRGERTIVPTGADRFQAGDEIFVVGKPKDMQAIARQASGAEQWRLERVMILGANQIGQHLAEMLQDSVRVTLADMAGGQATAAAERLQRTLVVSGEGEAMDLLEHEDLASMDALLAVDDDEELNLIACLLARRLGVRRTIARVERKNYRQLVKTIGVDATVSGRLATVNAILKYIRTGNIQAAARLQGVAAEAIELVPGPRSKVLDKPLQDVQFPPGAVVGAVARADDVIVPDGEFVIRQGDRVVVFALKESIARVEKLFG